MKSKIRKTFKKNKKVLKLKEIKKFYPQTPSILLWFIVLIIVFILSTFSIFWFRVSNFLITPEIVKTLPKPRGDFLVFRGSNGFTFQYPNHWSEIKMEDLPKESFSPEIKLLLMETDNKFMQFMALETLVDRTKDLKTLINEDLKRESKKIKDLKIIREEINDKEAFLELTYFTDGFMVRMLARDFLIKGEKESKVYSLAVQVADSKFEEYKEISERIINSAKIALK